ncbi:trypsin-like peptidase domain-containing protein [Bacillus testis]|uniref:trypsin-like peptidase domain-containing protein n=1 Tax=Bacillus testis TaxID=1622072 RepID=UPI00067EB93E|nr:trypsin-like peptidase domain-containing protein [Bacillus testis]
MYCSKCGNPAPQGSKYCPHCGNKVKHKKNKALVVFATFLSVICLSIITYTVYLYYSQEPLQHSGELKHDPKQKVAIVTKAAPPKMAQSAPAIKKKPSKKVSEIINDSLPKVFTIVNELGQGSGFLINRNGDVLTNAHVVEGSTKATIRTNNGEEYSGTVIGYSNDVDIAVIRVEALAGRTPLTLEVAKKESLGDKVIALGSPLGLENTATLGNISGVDRSFIIEPHTYDEIYQITAPIAPGSSGGPLLDELTEKVVAINSAKVTAESNIGFSIPLYKVMDTVNAWVNNPMSEQAILDLFYNEAGDYYYQNLYGSDSYFDGGSYNDEYGEEDEYGDESSYESEYSDETGYEDEYTDEEDSYQLPSDHPTFDEEDNEDPAESDSLPEESDDPAAYNNEDVTEDANDEASSDE